MISDTQLARILEATAAKVERVRNANTWHGVILVMPFVCYSCEEDRTQLALMTGDGLPLCCQCFGEFENAMDPHMEPNP